jgi:hypothetical protein
MGMNFSATIDGDIMGCNGIAETVNQQTWGSGIRGQNIGSQDHDQTLAKPVIQ